MTLRVWDIARGHAPPAWEPTAAPFRGGAPGPGGNNGFDALLRQLGAQGVVGKARSADQARRRRERPGFHQGPVLGAVVARAGAEDDPVDPPRCGRTVPPHGGPIQLGLPVGYPAQPDGPIRTRRPTIDRVPLPVRGRPSMPRGTECASSTALSRTDIYEAVQGSPSRHYHGYRLDRNDAMRETVVKEWRRRDNT